jgi:3-carboxy-cis,cis-muconate cycloisomerase
VSSPGFSADAGLLSPVRAGTKVEAIVSDEAWLDAMIAAETALARALSSIGVIPQPAADGISLAAQEHRISVREIAIASRETANPVVAVIEAFTEIVRRNDPTAANYVHRGSTSQDIFDTAAMLITRSALQQIERDLASCMQELVPYIRSHGGTVMPGRTLGLHAVPTTFGMKAAGWHQLLGDARLRVMNVLDGGLPVSLGGAAGTLAGYLEYALAAGIELADDKAAFARELTAAYARETGLSVTVLPWHTLRTPIADIAAVCAFVTGAFGKIAVDVLTLSRTEIGELSEPSRPGRGVSSAMPHKRNPVLATLIRSASIQVPALTSGLYACMVAVDERDAGAWHAEWMLLRESLRLTGGAAATAVELLGGVVVNSDAMSRNVLRSGVEMSLERLAVALAPSLGKAQAKALLSDLVDASRERGVSIALLARENSQISAALDEDLLAALLSPLAYTGVAESVVSMVEQAIPAGS